jgi:threonine 3-dehydrogenase
VLEISGSVAALNMGFRFLRQGGDVILLGLYNSKAEIDLNRDVVFKYATVKGINGRLMFDTWHRMKGLFRNPNFDVRPVITHKMPFDRFFEGMEIMRSGQCGKVVLTF